MKYSQTVKQWAEEYDVKSKNINIRKFITFGVLNHLIRYNFHKNYSKIIQKLSKNDSKITQKIGIFLKF